MTEPFPHRKEGSTSRNTGESICLVVNPRAGAGAAGQHLDQIRQAADRAFANWDLRVTEGPGHATTLAAQAASEEFNLVAAVGGDGTCNEVMNGLFDGTRPIRRKTVFSVIPYGTGSDLIKSLRIPNRLQDALWVAATGITLPTDVGHVRFTTPEIPRERLFLNVAGFGANGDVVDRANQMSKRWGGRLTFLSATVQSALNYQAPDVRLTWEGPDGTGEWEGQMLSCTVANGAYCGGGMWVGKSSSMQDGLLQVTIIPPNPIHRQVRELRHLYNGHPERISGARTAMVHRIHAEPRDSTPLPIDIDGEMPGFGPLEIEVLPRALHVRGNWTANPLPAPS
ncbi:MAG: diacylglycerol kinase family lipid kinase [Myxococcota bacterium]|jgi:YegS/Rv2252/BmrU family lipid kinase|nr:diacylglycerol kinase family lipid kinase [Myxococcota bacterium]